MTATATKAPVLSASRLFCREDGTQALLSYTDKGHCHEIRLAADGDFPAVYRLSTREAARKVWRAVQRQLTTGQGYSPW